MGLKTKRFGIISGLLVLMFILVASVSAQTPTPPVPPFLDNLNITPAELELGDNVTISVDITNMDSQHITYGVDIHIDNVNDPPSTGPPSPELWMRIWVELDAYESTSVSQTLTPETVGNYNVTVDGLTGSFTVGTWPPLRPAEFVVTGLMFRESEVEVGEENTIIIAIENVGEQSGNYTVTMRLENGPIIMVEEKEITLEGGWLKIVPFKFTLDVEGTYQGVVDGLTRSFIVKAPPLKPAEFVLSNFSYTFELQVGEPLRIYVDIANIGEQPGEATIIIEIDGIIQTDLQSLFQLGPGDAISQTWTTYEYYGPGTHTIELDGFDERFSVTPRPKGTPYTIYIGILILIIAAGVYILYRGGRLPISKITPGSDGE